MPGFFGIQFVDIHFESRYLKSGTWTNKMYNTEGESVNLRKMMVHPPGMI